jgi:hypothetical protein
MRSQRLSRLIGDDEAEALYEAWEMARGAWSAHLKTQPAPRYDELVDLFANQIERRRAWAKRCNGAAAAHVSDNAADENGSGQ